MAHRIVTLTITGLRTGAIKVDEISGEVNVRTISVQDLRRSIDAIEMHAMGGVPEEELEFYHGVDGSGFLLLRDMLQLLLLARVQLQTGDFSSLNEKTLSSLEACHEAYSCTLSKEDSGSVTVAIPSKTKNTPGTTTIATAMASSWVSQCIVQIFIEAEIVALRMACRTHNVIASIHASLLDSRVQISGEFGELDKDLRLRSGIRSLQEAIDEATASGPQKLSPSINVLKETASLVCDMRMAVAEGWEEVDRIMRLAVEMGSDNRLDPCSIPEINRVLEHLEKRKIVGHEACASTYKP